MAVELDLDRIINLKKTWDKKIGSLKFSLSWNSKMVKALNTLNLESSVDDVNHIMSEVIKLNGRNRIMAISAIGIFGEMKEICSRIVANFNVLADNLVDHFVMLDKKLMLADRKILRRIFDSIFNKAQGSYLNYRLLCHPQFLQAKQREP